MTIHGLPAIQSMMRPDEAGKIQYDSLMSVAAALQDSGRGSFLAKLDLNDAYRNIPVCSMYWNLLGFHWLEKYK